MPDDGESRHAYNLPGHEILDPAHGRIPRQRVCRDPGRLGRSQSQQGKTEEFEKSECHIRWLGQTIPAKAVKNPEEEFTAATFSNTAIPKKVSKAFPDGLQHGIEINNAFTGIKYELEGEPCEEWGKEEGPEGGGGTYFGSFPQFVTGGNLEYL